eukprot:scpid92611/ scgid24494/ 
MPNHQCILTLHVECTKSAVLLIGQPHTEHRALSTLHPSLTFAWSLTQHPCTPSCDGTHFILDRPNALVFLLRCDLPLLCHVHSIWHFNQISRSLPVVINNWQFSITPHSQAEVLLTNTSAGHKPLADE